MRREDLKAAVAQGSESESVEYKASFDPKSSAEWLEIIKDIVALANSGGGIILFGVADGGGTTGFDCTPLNGIDPAELTDKVGKYTGQQFQAFELIKSDKDSTDPFAVLVHGVATPIVFSKPGTYDVGGGKQKTAFAAGTVYFRHGAKSEPGNSEDLRWFVERRVEEIRKSWLDGIVKVVEAPAGTHVQIVETIPSPTAGIRLVDDPTAPAFYRASVDETHPFRQKEVVEAINEALKGKKSIKAFQVQCVRHAHQIEQNPTLCYKQKYASARYSRAFVDWILAQYDADSAFFENAKIKADELKHSTAASP
jgi:hypothetical protein